MPTSQWICASGSMRAATSPTCSRSRTRSRRRAPYSARAKGGKLVLAYVRGTFGRSTVISSSQPARVDKNGLSFKIRIEPHGRWSTQLDVATEALGFEEMGRVEDPARARRRMRQNLARWIEQAPRLESDQEPLKGTYRRSLVDLAALRFSPQVAGGRSLPAAGLPWFMTMFGRDSILTSLQALPFTSELAATTLRALGDWQGLSVNDFRDEDPGRILHEMRYGELTAFEERPHSPYYGSADATPLFVVLLDEYERWTGDRALVRELEVESRAALNWIDEYADLQGNGYLSYERRNKKTGLENQCWKDSWDSISFRDGRIPGFPRATCELQGYAYDAKRRGARLARLDLEGRRPGGAARAGSGRPQAPLQPGLLGRGRRVLRARARPRGPAGGRAHLEQRPSPLERHRRQVQGEGRRRAPARASALLRLGRPHPGRGRRPLQPDRLPRWHGLALRQLLHRLGPAAVRVQGRGRGGRGGHPGRCRVLRGAPAGGVRRLRALPDALSGAVPDGVQPASLVDRRAAPASADDARASSRRGSTWWSTRRSPSAIGHLELLDIPGRWGRIDAFGRGRVNVEAKRRRA